MKKQLMILIGSLPLDSLLEYQQFWLVHGQLTDLVWGNYSVWWYYFVVIINWALKPRSINNLLFNFRVCSGVGITLTFVAGIIRMATAIPGISSLGKNEQFWLCFLAQLLNGKYYYLKNYFQSYSLNGEDQVE